MPHTQAQYGPDDWLFFGKETAGLPESLRLRFPDRCIRIPMRPEVRCLNLSNAAAVVLYEALRQNGFAGLV
jgi:tRNA (cytidine/uridine-2'-O-)-methyltransferase